MKTATVCGMTIQRLDPIVVADLAASMHDNGYEAVDIVYALGTDDEQIVRCTIDEFMVRATIGLSEAIVF